MKIVSENLKRLVDWFSPYRGAVVSFSGGVDSSLVAYAAKKALGNKALAVSFLNPIFTEEKVERTRKVAEDIGIEVTFENLQLPKLFYRNPVNRCYVCKETMARILVLVKRKIGADVAVDSYHKGDLHDFMPGRAAMVRYGIRSPLYELGFGRREVKAMLRHLGFSWADVPSMPCLATRIPFGQKITEEKLHRIANAERIVKEITGAQVVRVRDHRNLARIEVDRAERSLFFDEDLMDRVHKELSALGYSFISLDLYGYKRGSVSRPARLS